MRRLSGLVAVLVVVGLAVGVGPLASPASACSCPSLSPAQVFDNAKAVFVGTLISHDVQDQPQRDVGRFEVHQVRKGTVAPRQAVAVALGTSCNGQPWEPGTYEISTSASPADAATDVLVTGGCSSPRKLTAAQVAAAGFTPAAAQTPPDQTKGVDGAVLLLAVATVGGAVGFLMILRRERRKKQTRRTAPLRRRP